MVTVNTTFRWHEHQTREDKGTEVIWKCQGEMIKTGNLSPAPKCVKNEW